jgi:hypothetical protein
MKGTRFPFDFINYNSFFPVQVTNALQQLYRLRHQPFNLNLQLEFVFKASILSVLPLTSSVIPGH